MVRSRLVLACVAAAVGAVLLGAAAGPAGATSLLPLARGQLVVSLGVPPAWFPVSGQQLSVTVFSGRPTVAAASKVNAYVALQRTSERCAPSASRDRARKLVLSSYYASSHLVSRQSTPFAPSHGAARGVYAVSVPGVVIRQRGSVRACVWLARSSNQRTRPHVQDTPLLDNTFAAEVSNVPSAASGAGGSYTLAAISGKRPFSYSTATTQCGTVLRDRSGPVAGGAASMESVSFTPQACAADGSVFSFNAGGRSLGQLTYTVANATSSPFLVEKLGACELDGLTVTKPADAKLYVQAVGCSVGRVLVAPFQRGVPRRAVVEAQVDGGVAELAPRGTAVDLVVNGH